MKQRKKKIVADFGINIIASGILTIMLQIVIYPLLASRYSDLEYGTILTIMGIMNIIIVTLGNSLNNVRLIQNKEYLDKNVTGDFNLLVIFALISASIAAIIAAAFFNSSIDGATFSALIIYVLFGTLRAYYVVAYRLILNFKKLLISNVIMCGGYLLGIFITIQTGVWPLSFALGEIAASIYILTTTSLVKEPCKKTELFKTSFNKFMILIGTTLIANLIQYLDRLLIYPVLGADSVSAYTVASFFGKSLGVVMVPIAGVLLGYYAQKDFKMSKKRFWKINITVLILSGAFYVFAFWISPWFTGLLYPTLMEQAGPYIALANLAAIISVTGNITQPAVLQYAQTYWQIVIQVIYGLIYVGGGLLALLNYGLTGFCYAAISASLIRLILLYIIGHRGIRKMELANV